MDLINDFEELKPILQEKWLDFYEKNLISIEAITECNYHRHYGYDGDYILLILIALVPELSKKMIKLKTFNEKIGGTFPSSTGWLNFFEIKLKREEISDLLEGRKKKQQEIDSISPSLLDDFRKPIN